MRDPELGRIHISVDKSELELWKKFAKETHRGFLSETVRAAMLELMRKSRGEAAEEIQPIVEGLNRCKETIANMDEELKSVKCMIESICSDDEVDNEQLLKTIVKILAEAHQPLSTEAVWEKLPAHDFRQILKGLEALKDQFAVDMVKQNGLTLWKLAGCKNAE